MSHSWSLLGSQVWESIYPIQLDFGLPSKVNSRSIIFQALVFLVKCILGVYFAIEHILMGTHTGGQNRNVFYLTQLSFLFFYFVQQRLVYSTVLPHKDLKLLQSHDIISLFHLVFVYRQQNNHLPEIISNYFTARENRHSRNIRNRRDLFACKSVKE